MVRSSILIVVRVELRSDFLIGARSACVRVCLSAYGGYTMHYIHAYLPSHFFYIIVLLLYLFQFD